MQEIYKNSLSKVFSWLKTWENNGGYNGYVVHRYNGRRLNLNNPTCWAQGPIICGLINLAKSDTKFEQDLINALKYQSGLLQDDGKYKYCGHEDDRFTSLIHCSLANEGLIEGYRYFIEKDSEFANSLLQTVEINIEKYLLTLWNEEYDAFKFNDIDFYSHDGDRFVANMNITFIYTLILFAQIKNTTKYDAYINRTLEWFFTQQIDSENKYLDSGFTYQQKVGVEPKMQNPVVIYNGIIAEYMAKIYSIYKDDRLLIGMKKIKQYIYNNFDEEKQLFYHDYVDDKLLKNPYFVAGSGFVLKGLYQIEQVLGDGDVKFLNITKNIIQKYQYENGGFKNFIGYNHFDNSRGGILNNSVIWEDIVPTVSWNAKMFEYLSSMASLVKKESDFKSIFYLSWNFFYFESKQFVSIFSIAPIKSIAFLFYKKSSIDPLMSFSLIDFYKNLRGNV